MNVFYKGDLETREIQHSPQRSRPKGSRVRNVPGLAEEDERMDHDIETIETAAAKMGQLLDELLELSRIGRIVEFHGGRIWAESEGLGQGATLCFVLPWLEP